MSDLSNSEYFAQRAIEAWAMSEAATDPRAADAHARMARQYEDLATDFSASRPSYQPVQNQVQAAPMGERPTCTP